MRLFVLGLGLLGFALDIGAVGSLGELSIELSPLLLGPAELLDRRSEVQEVDRDDGCTGPQVGVPDQGIQFPASLDESLVDLCKALQMLRRVTGPTRRQALTPCLEARRPGMRANV